VTRFAIDCGVLLGIVDGSIKVHPDHQLVSASLVRSQALATLYTAVRRGELDRQVGLERLERVAEIKVRLLGDRVSRSVAWKLADQLGLEHTDRAEILAVARLQADALVALDDELVRLADGVVPSAKVAALARPA
jgi:hypothetical protein